MPITPQNLVRHELIGLKVEIKGSSNKSQKGLTGRIIGETYSTIKIETDRGDKVIPKDVAIFIFTLPNGTKVQVEGKILIGRPEDRIKKKLPRW
jgi:ribonuclease P protein subunit POP4